MIKTYEGFFSKITDSYPQNKLAQAFVDFLNNIDINLNCYIKKDRTGNIRIESQGNILIYIDICTNLFKDKNLDITVFNSGAKLSDNIYEFIINVFESDIMTFDINSKDVPLYISKLTIENYELFIDTLKFNI